jgi:hypothetical protein
MTGPEHYRCAEVKLQRALTEGGYATELVAEALVHATLALAAATAANIRRNGVMSECGVPYDSVIAWRDVLE